MAVEAALVTPVLLLVLIGIIEMSLFMRDHVSVSSAVRVGARIASAGADGGPGTCEAGPTAPPCTSASSPALAQAAADAIQRAGTAMPSDSIDYILVYKANSQGFPGAEGSTTMPSSCSGITACVRFTWRDTLNAFRYANGTWDSKSINACLNEADAVGVYLQATHPWMTKIFGSSATLGDRAVMKFEPLPDDTCKSGRPAAHP